MRRSEQMGARVTHIVPRGTARRCSGCGSRTEAEHCIGPAILPPCSVTASESWGGAVAVGPSPAARQGHREVGLASAALSNQASVVQAVQAGADVPLVRIP
jgi:hypothetical protein